MPRAVSTTAYRYSGEILVLIITIGAVIAVIALTASATLCLSFVFIFAVLLLSYGATRAHHQDLLQHAQPVNSESSPRLARQIDICRRRLQPGDLQIFIVSSRKMNAYTFGLQTPKIIVLYSPLLQVMSADEMRFIIGHEMGHIRLGHTWLNSLIGGMAGIPSSLFINTLLAVIFRGWNRMCEYSVDRAGLLACGSIDTAVSAMVKLVAPDRNLSSEQITQAIHKLDAQDEDPARIIGEFFSTHPLLIRRIERLRKYARTQEYQRLQLLVNSNLDQDEFTPGA